MAVARLDCVPAVTVATGVAERRGPKRSLEHAHLQPLDLLLVSGYVSLGVGDGAAMISGAI